MQVDLEINLRLVFGTNTKKGFAFDLPCAYNT
jgi:hypothetical protein